MLFQCAGRAEWHTYYHEYLQVSYDLYLWCRMRFGDPRKFYGPTLRKAMGWDKEDVQ